ncbi:hypothetical protein DN069_26060 [Streptacidiphilus pinicola]|uniref:Lipoprotein n=1 Tax=Streptacidiphilus pinicola TaxID=2219663 RepID=A0A2X0K0D6_9ACTN|nr:hypothetical protein [Streptacidiphilus pinicola]RAG82715.1 hypothetical protein DN069_26060 [Streptacidiphilus pinicola]
MRAISGVRASSRFGVIGVVASAAALLSGCGMVTIGGAKTVATPAVTASGAVQSSAPTATASGAQGQVLAALPQRPATARDWTGAQDPSAMGILTVEQFIEADYTPSAWTTERGAQQSRGLQFAGRRAWYDPATATYVDSFVIHYASAAGAESDYLSQVKADAKNYDAQGSFTVPGVAKSKVFVKSGLDSNGNALTMGLAVAGDDVLRVVVMKPATPDHDTAVQVLSGEYQALTKS